MSLSFDPKYIEKLRYLVDSDADKRNPSLRLLNAVNIHSIKFTQDVKFDGIVSKVEIISAQKEGMRDNVINVDRIQDITPELFEFAECMALRGLADGTGSGIVNLSKAGILALQEGLKAKQVSSAPVIEA